MKQIKEATKLSASRNAEHYQFHHDVLDILTEEFATAQKIDALRTSYKELFDKEDTAFIQTRALAGTADVEAKDAVRDELLRYVCSIIDAKQYSPVADEKAAAKRLRTKVSPYWRANIKPYAENTALVDNMVQDMLSNDYSADTATLGLTDIVGQLKTANEDFNATYTGRSSEKETRELTEKMKTNRPQVDEAYRSLVQAVNSLYNVNALITKDAATETTLATAIDSVNGLILQLSQTVEIRMAKAASVKKTNSASAQS